MRRRRLSPAELLARDLKKAGPAALRERVAATCRRVWGVRHPPDRDLVERIAQQIERRARP